jgi:hypothetical protein
MCANVIALMPAAACVLLILGLELMLVHRVTRQAIKSTIAVWTQLLMRFAVRESYLLIVRFAVPKLVRLRPESVCVELQAETLAKMFLVEAHAAKVIN